jgi:predicted amidohydrolase
MKFQVAAIQMLAGDDKGANIKEAEHWVRQAAAAGARVVVLPEVFNWRGD